jgi:hypothetical protein
VPSKCRRARPTAVCGPAGEIAETALEEIVADGVIAERRAGWNYGGSARPSSSAALLRSIKHDVAVPVSRVTGFITRASEAVATSSRDPADRLHMSATATSTST